MADKHIEVTCEEANNETLITAGSVKYCIWKGGEYEALRTARTAAKQHVEHTGHNVLIAIVDQEWVTTASLG